MKKAIIVMMVFFVSSFLFSYEYIMNNNPSGIGSHTGNIQITTLSGGDWMDGWYDLALPTVNQFYYYGKLVTHLRISTEGYVVMGFGSASGDGANWSNDPIPYPINTPDNMVAPLWDDWDLTTTGSMWYELVTNANGNNWVSVEWRGVPHYGAAGTSYSFSCAFCNSTNCFRPNAIIFVYADVTSGNATYDNGASATAGIENSTGTIGEQFSYSQAIVTDGLKIVFTPFVPVYGSTTDSYDTDNYPDAEIFRPSNGTWYYKCSDGLTAAFVWGQKGDVALPGDYDNDGDSDEMVFRPSNSTWYCNGPILSKPWGTSGDIPVPADYNGDGVLDIGVFRPSNGTWYVYYMGSGPSLTVPFGTAGDIPLPADYDGDGHADVAVYRPSNNKWYIRKSSDLTTITKTWGTEGDVPMPTNLLIGSYSTITVFRPSNGFWYSFNQTTGSGTYSHQWGQDGDVPIPADQNAGSLTDETVFRPGTYSHWFLRYHDYLPASFIWGTLGDKPRFRRSNLIVSPPPSKGIHQN